MEESTSIAAQEQEQGKARAWAAVQILTQEEAVQEVLVTK